MDNINEILSSIGVEIPAEKQAEFNKKLIANYKTVAEFSKQAEKITTLEEKLSEGNKALEDLQNSVSDFDGTKKALEDLKAANKNLENEKKEREAAEKAKAEELAVENNINAALNGRKFVNDFTKRSLLAEVSKQLKDQANVGRGAADIFENLVKDSEGIFSNPQEAKPSAPAPKDGAEDSAAKTLKNFF